VLYAHQIAESLAVILPASASQIRDRAETYAGRVAQLDSALAQLFQEIPAPQRRLVMIRDEMAYFGARYAVAIRSLPDLPAGAAPSAQQLRDLGKAAQQDGASAVLSESDGDPKASEELAKLSGIKLAGPVYTESLSEKGGPAATYIDLLRTNAQTIAAAMKA
jgi:ABC-type Zn uptake system ZnuABC Zn-binding protein ZnuA